MKHLLFVFILAGTAHAGSYTITTTDSQDKTLRFAEQALGQPAGTIMQQFCIDALRPHHEGRLAAQREGFRSRYDRLTPEQKEQVDALLGPDPTLSSSPIR